MSAQIDQHSQIILLYLAKEQFEAVDYDFRMLSQGQKVIVGNQQNLNILRRYIEQEVSNG